MINPPLPRVSVLLPVHNGEKYLAQAIDSVLAQTFGDFELIIINDGSTDRTAEILKGISDKRLRVVQFSENRGLVAALNRGIQESRAELIARMDHDDICMPRRFERQVAFLGSHPQVAICGTWTRQFGGETGIRQPPVEAKQIRARLFFGLAMDHPSIMMRSSFLACHGLTYDACFRHVEDYDFFLRAAELGDLANLPEVLLCTRSHAEETSMVHQKEQLITESILMVRELRKLVPTVTDKEEEFHLRFLNGHVEASDLSAMEEWLLRLNRANSERGTYDVAAFRRELCRHWYRVHAQTIGEGLGVLISYNKAVPAFGHKLRVRECALLAAKLAYIRMLGVARMSRRDLHRRQGGESTTGR